MIHALALAASIYTVRAGDTLSGIAANAGISLSSLEAANPQISDFNLIYAGESVNLSGGSVSSQSPSSISSVGSDTSSGTSSGGTSSGSSSGYSSGGSSSGYSSGSLSDIPGVPSGFASCVAFHESTNGTNQAYNGGVYGIISASGINVNGQSLAAQKQAFAQLYSQYGTSPWRGDGCA